MHYPHAQCLSIVERRTTSVAPLSKQTMHADEGLPPELTDGDAHARRLNKSIVVVPFVGPTPEWGVEIALARLAQPSPSQRALSVDSKRRRHAGTDVVSAQRLTGNSSAVQSVACQTVQAGQRRCAVATDYRLPTHTSWIRDERARPCPMRKVERLARQGSAASPSQVVWWLPQDSKHPTRENVQTSHQDMIRLPPRCCLHHGRFHLLSSPDAVGPAFPLSTVEVTRVANRHTCRRYLGPFSVPNAASCAFATCLCCLRGFCFLCHQCCMCCLEAGAPLSLFSPHSFK